MKKQILSCLCAAILMSGLAGCGGDADANQTVQCPAVEPTPVFTEKTDMEPVASPRPLLDANEQDLDEANQLLQEWNTRCLLASDIMRACIQMDCDTQVEIEGSTYFKVTDPRYQSMDDLYKTIDNVSTEAGLADIGLDCVEMLYTEKDGQLYCRHADIPFIGDWTNEIVGIVEKAEDRWVLRVECDKYAEWVSDEYAPKVDIMFVKEDGVWKFAGQEILDA